MFQRTHIYVCCKGIDLLCHSLTECKQFEFTGDTLKECMQRIWYYWSEKIQINILSLFSLSWRAEEEDEVGLKLQRQLGHVGLCAARTYGLIWTSAPAGASMGARHWVMLTEELVCTFRYLNNVDNLNRHHQNITLYLHTQKTTFLLNSCQVLNKGEKQKWKLHLLSLCIVCSLRGIYTAWRISQKEPH